MKFVAQTGHALDMGTFTFEPSVGNLLGTSCELRIGRNGVARATLSSANPPPNSVMHWEPSTGDLSIDLSEDLIDEIGPGIWSCEFALLTASGRRRYLRRDILQIVPELP